MVEPVGQLLASGLLGWVSRQLTRAAVPRVARANEQVGLVRRNWAGRQVPTAVGVVPAVLGLVCAGLMGRRAAAATAAAATLAGWMDDVAARTTPKGLMGHLRASWQERRPTPGVVKMVAVPAVALLALRRERPDKPFRRAFLEAASMALTANGLNQLDTRPGRAGWAFLAGLAYLAWRAPRRRRWRWLPYLPMAAAVAAYLPYDQQQRAMLGDSGANGLGAALGALAADLLPDADLARWVLGWACATALMDRVSLSEAVERLQRWSGAPGDGRKFLGDRRTLLSLTGVLPPSGRS